MLKTLLDRHSQTTSGWQKIPWHDPDFSRRMLAEHLNQTHDLASRRFNIIEQQITWLQRKCLPALPAKILDLGCGPGFYSRRLSALGYQCVGIDFSPASIEYARAQDSVSQYILENICTADYGTGYDLVLLIFGELNAFAPDDAQHIITKAHAALKPAGKLILEVSSYEAIYRIGHDPAAWHTATSGLFADEPYLCLTESRYEADHAVTDFYVFLAANGAMQHYVTMHQAYTEDEYRSLLKAFESVQFFPSLTGSPDPEALRVIVAEKHASA